MGKSWILGALLSGIAGIAAIPTNAQAQTVNDTKPKANADSVDSLIEKLADVNASVRDAAERELTKQGKSALLAVRRKLTSDKLDDDMRDALKGFRDRLTEGLSRDDRAWVNAQIERDSNKLVIRVVSKKGTVILHGEAKPAAHEVSNTPDADNGEGQAKFGETIERINRLKSMMAEGDLTKAEIDRLEKRIKEDLRREMQEMDDKESKIKQDDDPEDRAENMLELKRGRYKASIEALEDSLLERIRTLLKHARGADEDSLEEIEDKIETTFEELLDDVDDTDSAIWKSTLDKARKFHKEYGAQIDKYETKIGVDTSIPNATEALGDMKRRLIGRLRRIRRIGGNTYEDNLDALEEKIYENFENLEEKAEDALPKTHAQLLEDGKKFFDKFTKDLDAFAEAIGSNKKLPNARKQLDEIEEGLLRDLRKVRKRAPDRFEDNLDDLQDKIRDTYADLQDKLDDQTPKMRAMTLEIAVDFKSRFDLEIKLWDKRVNGDKIDRGPDVPRGSIKPRESVDSPEKDIQLKKGEHADIVDGLRVARLLPMPRKQLGLENGLSVKEIVDADGALARAGLDVYDIILKIDDDEVDTRNGLRVKMKAIESGKEFKITILRNGKEKTLTAKK